MNGIEEKKDQQLNFCPNCGTKVDREEVDGISIKRTICIQCHKDIEELLSNILQERLFVKECTNCRTIGTIDAKFCFNCGSKELVRRPRLAKRTKRLVGKSSEKKVIDPVLKNILYINSPMILFTIIYGIVRIIWKSNFPKGVNILFATVIILTLFMDIVYLTGLTFRTIKKRRIVKRRVRLEKFFEKEEEEDKEK